MSEQVRVLLAKTKKQDLEIGQLKSQNVELLNQLQKLDQLK